MKLLKPVIFVVLIIFLIGAIYETITSYFGIRARDSIIAELRADYRDISVRLDKDQIRITALKKTISNLRQGSVDLGEQLAASTRIAADLSEEDRRLAEALSDSEGSARAISATSGELRKAINRVWEIVERYEVPIETK